ncbi:MAG: hypothetical protein ACLQMF_07230 [Rectinemataceae bacterium]
MAVIDSILDEELARLLTLQERLSKEHEALPRGTLVVKSKNGHHYAYRAYREGRRVITDYVGPELSIQVQHLSAALMERRRISAEVKALAADIAKLRRMINAG